MGLTFTPHPILKAPTPAQIVKLSKTKAGQEALLKWHTSYHAKLRLAEEDPLNHGFSLEHWDYAEDILREKTGVIALGGNRCYDPESTWIYDPVLGKHLLASEITEGFHCYAIDVNGDVVVAKAEKPYRKGRAEMFEVIFDDGSSSVVTENHEFLTSDQQPVALKDMEIGSLVLGYESQGQSDLRDTRNACVQQHPSSASDSQSYYPACCGSYGEPALSAGVDDRASSPSQVDAQEHSPDLCSEDDPFAICIGSRELSLLRPWENSSSSQDVEQLPRNWKVKCQALDPRQKSLVHHQALPEVVRCAHLSIDSQLCEEPASIPQQQSSEQPSGNCQFGQQSPDSLDLRNEGSELDHNRIFCDLPYLTIKRVVSILSRGILDIYDHTVPEHGNYLANGVCHKNSGKTEWGARTVVKAAIENDGAQIVCFAQDADASVRVQQSAVFRYLPRNLKQKQKGQVEYINYSTKNGFTGGSLIMPNGSAIYFHTYSQFIANRSKFEGLELGAKEPKWLNIGLWLDEYLEDGDLVETMRFRLATRNSLMIITVTPIDGYTPFVASFLRDAETKKTRKAELLNNEDVPLIQICKEKDAGIVYFHSQLNPFGGYDRIKKELAHSPRDEILTRAYGIPVKSMTTLFPLFNSNVHVVDEIPADVGDKKKWTVYHVVDPASARNYVAIWAAVNAKGEVCVLREWPDRETYGPWAEFGDPKWKFGPASKKMGYNVKGYVDLFKEIEHEIGVEPEVRIGDSRFFAAENEDNVDLFTAFGEEGMHFEPSDGRHEDMGISKLDEFFHYNPNVGVDEVNKPLMTIHEGCGNTIYSIMNYGQNGKKDEPLKDFIDCPRYLAMANAGEGPYHFGGEAIKFTRQGKGY